MRVFLSGSFRNQVWSWAGRGLCLAVVVGFGATTGMAGGPKYVAGMSYFNAGVLGQPLRWASGAVSYSVDQGALSATVNHLQAVAMVDQAAAAWSGVATAAVTLTDSGLLNEDVSGTNVVAGPSTGASSGGTFSAPADVTPAATNYPIGVVFDTDGSVIEALFGAGASDPASCQIDGVFAWLDGFNPDATFAHGMIVLNGRCADTTGHLTMMGFQLERAFGRVLGLDYSQVNQAALTSADTAGLAAWPIMQARSGACGAAGGNCLPGNLSLRWDDVAAVSRLYPVNAGNVASFPGKVITATHTVSIQGTISFRNGGGMQGVNAVATPLDGSGNRLEQYAVSFVSGAYFNGKRGNPVTGWTDQGGNLLTRWGSSDAAMQGFIDLSAMPLPPGMMSANYQVTFEAIDSLDLGDSAVGPYVDGTPLPSGTMPTVFVSGVAPGSPQSFAAVVSDSAAGGNSDAIATEEWPRALPVSGMWSGRLGQVGQTDWFEFPVRGGRVFTVVTVALDERRQPSDGKAMPALGVWDGFQAIGSAAPGFEAGLNGAAAGESWLQVTTFGDDTVRLGVADARGDGRPDYAYSGWVLYADTVTPERLPSAGGPMVIRGRGFRFGDSVWVDGQAAQVTSIAPNEITAIAPAAATGVSGSVDVEVDDDPQLYAAALIADGVSYDSGNGDGLTLISAPSGTVAVGVPMAFAVRALGTDGRAAGGVTVAYTASSGSVTLGCGQTTCLVTSGGDGEASMTVTAMDGNPSVVTARLTNGASLEAHFEGGTAPVVVALNPALSLAGGATLNWTMQALVLQNGIPASGQTVNWQAGAGMAISGSTGTVSDGSGVASETFTVGPLSEGQQVTATACLNGTAQCVSFTAFGARSEYAWLEAVAGTVQNLDVSGTPDQITMRVRDMDGNPMAGGTVMLAQTLFAWAPACPPRGRCAQAQQLAMQTATATSDVNGIVNFAPASLPGVATSLLGVAATGDFATLGVAIEAHP